MGNCLTFTQLCKKEQTQRNVLRVSAEHLTSVEHIVREAKVNSNTCMLWEGWCPCCKKPLDICWMKEDSRLLSERTQETGSLRYAYAAAIWGDGQSLAGFVQGALVLGASLKSHSNYDRVLMHTDEVPMVYLELLQHVWTLQPVSRIQANSDLFTGTFEGHRFEGVFTKLHALNLLSYDKVLMMDIDIVIIKSPDELFQVKAPAAMRRGNSSNLHGERMHGRSFFGGQSEGWMQTAGINAGIMLLEPNKKDFDQMILEVCSVRHPERVPGNGPEQDYLSRYYASKWHHISFLYNFQIHHIFYAMEQALKHFNGITDSSQWWDEEPNEYGNIKHGTCLRCKQLPYYHSALPIYVSPFSFDVIGNVKLNEYVDAVGRVIVVESGWRLVPIKIPSVDIDAFGFVDCRQFDIVQRECDKASDKEYEYTELPMNDSSNKEHNNTGLPLNVVIPERLSAEVDVNVWIPERLSAEVDDIHIVHFSGDMKMWHRDYTEDETDEQFAERLVISNASPSPRLWIEKQGDVSDYAEFGIQLRHDGFDILGSTWLHSLDSTQKRATIQKIISQGVQSTLETTRKATKHWRKNLEALPALCGLNSVHEIMAKLNEDRDYSIKDVVDVYWTGDGIWYEGIIVNASSSNYCIKFKLFDRIAWIHSKYLSKRKPRSSSSASQ